MQVRIGKRQFVTPRKTKTVKATRVNLTSAAAASEARRLLARLSQSAARLGNLTGKAENKVLRGPPRRCAWWLLTRARAGSAGYPEAPGHGSCGHRCRRPAVHAPGAFALLQTLVLR